VPAQESRPAVGSRVVLGCLQEPGVTVAAGQVVAPEESRQAEGPFYAALGSLEHPVRAVPPGQGVAPQESRPVVGPPCVGLWLVSSKRTAMPSEGSQRVHRLERAPYGSNGLHSTEKLLHMAPQAAPLPEVVKVAELAAAQILGLEASLVRNQLATMDPRRVEAPLTEPSAAALQLLAARPLVETLVMTPIARQLAGPGEVEPLAIQLQPEAALPLREPVVLKAPMGRRSRELRGALPVGEALAAKAPMVELLAANLRAAAPVGEPKVAAVASTMEKTMLRLSTKTATPHPMQYVSPHPLDAAPCSPCAPSFPCAPSSLQPGQRRHLSHQSALVTGPSQKVKAAATGHEGSLAGNQETAQPPVMRPRSL